MVFSQSKTVSIRPLTYPLIFSPPGSCLIWHNVGSPESDYMAATCIILIYQLLFDTVVGLKSEIHVNVLLELSSAFDFFGAGECRQKLAGIQFSTRFTMIENSVKLTYGYA